MGGFGRGDNGLCGFTTFRNLVLPDQAVSSIWTRYSFGVRQSSAVCGRVVVEEIMLGEPGRDVGDGERAVVSFPELDSG